MYKYCVCFIKQGNSILMLNRDKPPIMGVWNGVGGKINVDETPLQGARREIFEETGIEVNEPVSQGIITWSHESGETDGLYSFLFEVQSSEIPATPLLTKEGILHWKDIGWILDENNLGIPEKIPYYLPKLLQPNTAFTYHFQYGDGKIAEMSIS